MLGGRASWKDLACCVYLFRHLASSLSAMSDIERDQIDSEAEEFIQVCSERIRALQHSGTWCSVDGHNMTGTARAYYAGIMLPAFQSSCDRRSPS